MMNRLNKLLLGLYFFCIWMPLRAQEPIPPPTSPPVYSRLHYSYNHAIPIGVYEHEDVCVSIFVSEIQEGDEARIHFREKSGSALHMMPLGYNQTDGAFAVCIDERYHDNKSIQYYIELFPTGLASIRIPEDPGSFNTVKIKKRASRYIEPIMVGLLIVSPAFAAFLYNRIRKAHARRRAEYENRLRARRRKLHKEREKHYKEYLKSLSGRKVAIPQQREDLSDDKTRINEPIPDTSQTSGTDEERSAQKVDSPPTTRRSPVSPATGRTTKSKPRMTGIDETDKELRRELDNILNIIPTDQPVEPVGPKKLPPRRKTAASKPVSGTPSDQKAIDDIEELTDEDKKKLLDLFKDS